MPELEKRELTIQADHLTVHQIGEHGVELLRLTAVDLIRPQMFGPPFRPRAIPFDQEGLLRASGLAPTDAVAYGRMGRRHRLTVHANQLAQPARDASVAISEPDPLRTNPAGPTLD